MSFKSAEKTSVSLQSTTLELKVTKTDTKSAGIAATGLFYNKV